MDENKSLLEVVMIVLFKLKVLCISK